MNRKGRADIMRMIHIDGYVASILRVEGNISAGRESTGHAELKPFEILGHGY